MSARLQMLVPVQHTHTTRHLTLAPMPQGSVALSENARGVLTAHVTAFGFTPGSQHLAEK